MRKAQEMQMTAAHEKLQSFCQAMMAGSKEEMWERIQQQIRHCKFQKAWDKKHKKLEIMLVPQSMADTIWPVMESILKREQFWKPLVGIAPKGDLERKLQKFLDSGEVPVIEEIPDDDF